MFVPITILMSALYVTGPSGNVYMAANDVPDGACVMSGTEEIVYEASNVNNCNQIVLEPGCYRAELRGGVGTKNKDCVDFVDLSETSIKSAVFSLSEPTTVYVFRGGDGNPGTVNTTSGKHGTFGGGASGVDSLLVVGDRVWRAEGGTGNTCTISYNNSALNRLYSATAVAIGNGFGGKSGLKSANGYRGFRVYKTDTYGVGGGGGGSPSDNGGTSWQYNNTSSYPDVVIEPGEAGNGQRGGDGGDVTSCATYKCTDYASASGGTGGTNVEFSCGGQVAVSYGGGGGGGAVNGSGTSTTYYVNGGNGGSGSTGSSDVSFVRIYKM